MNARQLARYFAAAKRDRRGNFREYFKAGGNKHILCESESEMQLWESFNEALEKKQIDMNRVSIRELFEETIPGGREIVESWNPRHGEGSGISLTEAMGAIDTGLFSNITGQIIYNRILEAFVAEENIFSKVVPNIPTSFNGEKIAGISRIGDDAQVVEEGRPYPLVGVSEDYIQTPVTVKRGMIDALTKEAVFFDRTGVLLQRAGEVGEYLGVNKEKRIIDAIIDQNVTTHRYNWKGTTYATYQSSSPWINVKTTNSLVDWTNMDAAEQVLAKIVDPYTGEPVEIQPKHLVVQRGLLYTARRIVTATRIESITPGYATSGNPNKSEWENPIQGYTILSSQQLFARMNTASEAATDWFIGDIEKAVNYMENFPLTVVQAPANNTAEFERDIVMQWKASERGATVVVQPRALLKSSA